MPANLENSAVATGLVKVILISDKIDFKIKAVKRDKEGHYIMIKGSIQEENITIINIYAPNIGVLQYVRQMLTRMRGEINHNTIIVGDFAAHGSLHRDNRKRSSAFSKSSLNIWKFTVHVLLKPGLENFEHYFTSV